ncbi:MAG: AAA family ATPase, partial [Bacteroidetes bacterium]|nr:AAA family ATPase [Bacteroidota bacterium]
MATLFVNSVESYAGKTAICIGLAAMLAKAGLSVGYMKPIGSGTVTVGNVLADDDAIFAKRMLDLDDPTEDICPIVLTQEMREKALQEGLDKSEALVAAHQRASKKHDVLVMEGIGNLATGYIIGLPPARIAKLTDAVVITVTRYKRELSAEDILFAKDIFCERLGGVIINHCPESERTLKRNRLAGHFLPREGVRLLGILPVDPLLNAITVGELTSLLGGRVLCRPEKEGELVETFSIGAMTADSALRYFLRSPNKAVITGGDRSEIQLAALQT